MEKLLAYIKSLQPGSQEVFAAACGTSIGYLRKACYTKQELGPELSVRIEKVSGGKVSRMDLHPASWALKWPELAEKVA
jgi:DNA-binding transcriptional regulator YdaS (Cro superfamily)